LSYSPPMVENLMYNLFSYLLNLLNNMDIYNKNDVRH
jgi:hypothetical protein